MRIAVVNYVWDADLDTAEAVLDRFFTLTDWSDAVRRAGATEVVVFQRFRSRAIVERNGIQYQFHPDAADPAPSIWRGGAEALHAAVTAAGPTLVHVNGVLHPVRVRGLRARLQSHAALLVQDHGGVDPATGSWLKRGLLRRGLAAADGLLVSSAGQAEEWRRSGLAPPGLSLFDVMESSTRMTPIARDEARQQSGVDGSPALLWVGRLNANKDPLTVLRGCAAFFERCPDARLTMVHTSGELEPEVQRVVEATPALAGRVRLAGRVARDRMPAFHSAADLFVLGSHREGSGYAAIEALACGALPVVTDIPSLRALTGDGEAGVLWRAGDAGSLAAALDRARPLLSEPHRERRRRFFADQFSWPAIGRRALEIYGQVQRERQDRIGPIPGARRSDRSP